MSEFLIYDLVRSHRRRTAGITITHDNRITVHLPWCLNERHARKLVEARRSWILKILKRNQPYLERQARRRYDSGEKFFYLGKSVELIFEPGVPNECRLERDQLVVRAESSQKDLIVAVLTEWYKTAAEKFFAVRLSFYERQMGVLAREVRIRNLKACWGSCSPSETVTLNWRLIMAPLEVIDYVIVHELAHIRHLNHSRRFWEYVARYTPDHARHRKWLNQNGRGLIL